MPAQQRVAPFHAHAPALVSVEAGLVEEPVCLIPALLPIHDDEDLVDGPLKICDLPTWVALNATCDVTGASIAASLVFTGGELRPHPSNIRAKSIEVLHALARETRPGTIFVELHVDEKSAFQDALREGWFSPSGCCATLGHQFTIAPDGSLTPFTYLQTEEFVAHVQGLSAAQGAPETPEAASADLLNALTIYADALSEARAAWHGPGEVERMYLVRPAPRAAHPPAQQLKV